MTRATFLFNLLCLAALGCGSADGGKGAAAVQGSWNGEWLSRTGVGGTATLHLEQAAGGLSGSITFTDSPCFSSGSISASVDGDAFSATVTAGAIDVTLEGTLTGDHLSGTYDAISAGACTGDTGTFSATR